MSACPTPGRVGEEHPYLAISTRPAVPEYWRCTPAERVPFFRKPVSPTYADVGIGRSMPSR